MRWFNLMRLKVLNVSNSIISDLPKMSGYRCVNYYELCRLCTASQGTKKIHIFSEEAKRTNLLEKISGCLPIIVSFDWSDCCSAVFSLLVSVSAVRRWARMTNYRKSCVPSVWPSWNRSTNSGNHVWMLNRCWRVASIRQNWEMEKRFECVLFVRFSVAFPLFRFVFVQMNLLFGRKIVGDKFSNEMY